MANIDVTIQIDESLKDAADRLFVGLGLSFSEAVVLFAKQCVASGNIPFEAAAASDEEIEPISAGLMKKNDKAYKELGKFLPRLFFARSVLKFSYEPRQHQPHP